MRPKIAEEKLPATAKSKLDEERMKVGTKRGCSQYVDWQSLVAASVLLRLGLLQRAQSSSIGRE